MQILSIDFDFFQNTTKDAIANYPDGIDLPTKLSLLVWATHYATNEELLRTVTINDTLLHDIKNILKNQDHDIPVMIANSHIHAYNFIKSMTNHATIITT